MLKNVNRWQHKKSSECPAKLNKNLEKKGIETQQSFRVRDLNFSSMNLHRSHSRFSHFYSESIPYKLQQSNIRSECMVADTNIRQFSSLHRS